MTTANQAPTSVMKTFRPTTDVRIKAVQFVGWTPQFTDTYPMRYIIEDDALNKGHYELWVERDKLWKTIAPGDWIILEKNGPGFYPCPEAEFKQKYEQVI